MAHKTEGLTKRMGFLKDAIELAATAVRTIDRWENTMATWNEQLQALTDQLSKASGEIIAHIDELVAALDSPTPEQQTALDGLRAQAQALDDIVVDAPEPEALTE